jgi:Protein of unknown function (DUF433)
MKSGNGGHDCSKRGDPRRAHPQDWSEADIIRNYPGIAHADIAACLQYASEVLQSEKVYPVVIDSAT